MSQNLIRYWQSLTTKEVAQAVDRDPVLIVPLAAIEQHGPHLPLSTDLDIGIGLLTVAFQHLASDFPAWVVPPLAVGASDEHMRLPGTLSLTSETLSEVIYQYGAALAASGVRRIVLSNSHGGNRHALDNAGLRLRRTHGLLVVKINYFEAPPPPAAGVPESEWRHGLHGGAVETAMMLHLGPDLVHRDEIRDARPLGEELERSMRRLSPEGPVSFSWLTQDINVSGVAGDARQADASKGRLLVEHYGEVLADAIRDARAFPLERLM
ncbi:MAG: creatininase family protein [Acidobacteria bacterium]|nr:MAG: creatininase family protein [Acidobacteriota bacterium]